jgi:hypothetical protein
MLSIAFKEWAVICRALADGRQALILRKGGISETGGEFRVEHTRFWLYPTYFHEQRNGVRPDAAALFDQVEADRPPEGTLRLTHFAEVAGAYHVRQLMPLLMLEHLHLWSDATVEKRFAYRTPGLYVLPVRVYRVPQAHEAPDDPAFAGCRTWVDLGKDLPTDGATPVVAEEAFRELLRTLDDILKPTAFA